MVMRYTIISFDQYLKFMVPPSPHEPSVFMFKWNSTSTTEDNTQMVGQ
jgi:hypothetical protein